MNRSQKSRTFANALLVAEQRLRDHGHRVTSPRKLVLALLLRSDCASTQDDVSKALANAGHKLIE